MNLEFNPYTANPQLADLIREARRGNVRPNTAQVGMIEIGQMPGGAMQPAAASPVFGGFGALPGIAPVVETRPKDVRGSALGFDSTTDVAAAGTATVTSRPQQAFRPEKLVVDASIATAFLITDIRIGNTSMLLNATGIPASVFIPNAEGIHLRWKTAQPAQDVVLNVSNISAQGARFLAAMTGTVAE